MLKTVSSILINVVNTVILFSYTQLVLHFCLSWERDHQWHRSGGEVELTYQGALEKPE